MKKKNNVIFIAKTSNTKKQFENLGSLAGDIFYYNHVTNNPGFSKIICRKKIWFRQNNLIYICKTK